MKKVFILLGCVILSGLIALGFTISVNAEGEVDVEEQVIEEQTVEETQEELSGWELFVKEYLSAEKVAMYMSWIAYIGTIIGLVANLNKLKKSNNLTLEKVKDMITVSLKEVVSGEVASNIDKFLPSLLNAQEKTNDILKTFSKILALSQENTPESRVAILHLIEELGTASKEVIDNAKVAIETEVQLAEEHKEEINVKLDEIIEEYDGTSI